MKGTFLSISSLSFVLLAFVIFPLNAAVIASAPIDLSSWKLQIPGPKEIKDLQGYSSDYFEKTPDGWIVFHIDAAEKGDPLALEVFEYTGELLGRSLADTVHCLGNEAFFLFGGAAAAGDYIVRPTRDSMERHRPD